MRYAIIIEKGGKNYSGYAPDVPGCVATGKTVAETVRGMREALEFHFDGITDDGREIPDPTTLCEYIEVVLPTRQAASGKRRKAS